MKQIILITLYVFALSSDLYPQFTQDWVSRYTDTNSSFSNKIAKDSQGNIYVSGSVNRVKYLLIKYNSNGAQEWVRTYYSNPAKNTTVAAALCIDNDDNIIISGEWGGYSSDDLVTIKYNPN